MRTDEEVRAKIRHLTQEFVKAINEDKDNVAKWCMGAIMMLFWVIDEEPPVSVLELLSGDIENDFVP